jgi:hypothetical protein
MLLLYGCIPDGNVWYGGGPLTVEIDGSATLPAAIEIPGVAASELEAALHSDRQILGPGGAVAIHPASVLAAEGEPAWAAAWDRVGGAWTGEAELHAWASVYNDDAPIIVCDRWLSRIGIVWAATEHPYPESPRSGLSLRRMSIPW